MLIFVNRKLNETQNCSEFWNCWKLRIKHEFFNVVIDIFILIVQQNINLTNLQRFQIFMKISKFSSNKIIRRIFIDTLIWYGDMFPYWIANDNFCLTILVSQNKLLLYNEWYTNSFREIPFDTLFGSNE